MTNPPLSNRQLAYLSPWLDDISAARIESFGVSGGLSGAVIWRVVHDDRELCLRRWPQAHPSLTGLLAIHGLLRHVRAAGFDLAPVPLPTRHGATHFAHEDHLWELTTWLPGAASLGPEPTREKLATAMQALARFHEAARDYHFQGDKLRSHAARTAPSPGLRQRLAILESLQHGELQQLWQAVRIAQPSELREMAFELLEGLDRSLEAVTANLRQMVDVPLPLQWCLRDVRHDHILFTDDSANGLAVSGLIDFGAAAVDSVAGDLARLLGSVVDGQPASWQASLEAYAQHRPLSPAERRAIVGFDEGGLLCSATNWVRWLYVESRSFPKIHALHAQLVWLRDRLKSLAERRSASVAELLAGPTWERSARLPAVEDRLPPRKGSPWMHT